jgi:hypothetical protein
MDARPGGPATKREPSPEGLGLNPEDDPPAPACRGSAVGAALNLGPLATVSLGANSGFPTTLHSSTATCAAFFKKSRMSFTETAKPDRKSGGSRPVPACRGGTCSSADLSWKCFSTEWRDPLDCRVLRSAMSFCLGYPLLWRLRGSRSTSIPIGGVC